MAAPMTRKAAPKTGHVGVGRDDRRSPALLDFVSRLMAPEPPELKRIRETTPAKGLPPISIGPDEGQLLDFLARSVSAKRAVEVGTLAGYSAAWIARALPPDGKLHTIEFDPYHAQVARANLAEAGLAGKVAVHQGAGEQVLPTLEKHGPFDLCFIDADKVSYPKYIRWACTHVRPGGLVVGDNAYLFGKLHLDPAKAGDDAPGVPAMREFLSLMTDKSLFSTCAMIPTGEGLAVAVRK